MNIKLLWVHTAKIFTIFLSFSILSLFASCSNEKESDLLPNTPETPIKVIKEGQTVFSQLLLGDKILEEVIDEIVNFGDDEFEILFHVNKSHKVNGEDVPPGPADVDCTYYSLTREEIEGFIKLFAVLKGIADTPQLTDGQKRQAFEELFYLLKESKIELALLVYLSNGSLNELKALDKMLSQTPTRSFFSNTDLNMLLESMVRGEVHPSEMIEQIESQNITFSQFINRAERNGYDICHMIETRMGVVEIIKTVVDGAVLLSKLIIAFVEKAQPVVDFESVYASMLHQDDLDPLNYYDPEIYRTDPVYEMRYGTKQTPMAQCKFRIETYYNARNDKFPHWTFVPRIGIIVEKVRCTAGMHVEGKIAFGTSTTYENDFNGYDAFSDNEVIVDYGDVLCFSRHGRLKFRVDSSSGFYQYGQQHNW